MLLTIYGEDSYRSLRYLQKLKKNFIEKFDKQKLNLDEFDLNDKTMKYGEIHSLFFSTPFLANKRLIIFKNILNHKNLDKNADDFLNNLEKIKSADNIIIFYETFKALDKRKKLHKNLLKELTENKELYHFPTLEGFALNKWIKDYIRDNNAIIQEEAIKKLAAMIGPNLWQQEQEINKLIAYKNNERIAKEDVELLTQGKYEDYIFKLIDNVSERNFQAAYELLEYQVQRGQDIMAIWHLLIRQFRLLIQSKQMIDKAFSKNEISKCLALHPYVVTQMIKQAKNFSLDRLKIIYKYLNKWEEQFKTNESKIDTRFLIELFIISI